MLTAADSFLDEIIQPFAWNFLHDVLQCISFIEHQLREGNQIILIASGSLGYELIITAKYLIPTLSFVYIYCSQLGRHDHWMRHYPQVRGPFNDPSQLGKQIKVDLEGISPRSMENNRALSTQSTARTQVRNN